MITWQRFSDSWNMYCICDQTIFFLINIFVGKNLFQNKKENYKILLKCALASLNCQSTPTTQQIQNSPLILL